MHQIARGTEPCGLGDGHRGRHRTVAGAAREAARSASQHHRELVQRWKAAHPDRVYLQSLAARRRAEGHA